MLYEICIILFNVINFVVYVIIAKAICLIIFVSPAKQERDIGIAFPASSSAA